MNKSKVDMKQEIGRIIASRRKELNLGQKDVCALIPELEESALSNYERGRRLLPLDIVKPLAAVLRTTPAHLLALDQVSESTTLEVTTTNSIKGRIPVMAWSAVCTQTKATTIGCEYIDTTEPVNAHTFALTVRDDSMETKFPVGAIIVVDPDMQHQPGDYVIVCNGTNDATFRQIVQDGAEWFLKPENERYPIRPLDKNARIVGVVTAMEMKFRRKLT